MDPQVILNVCEDIGCGLGLGSIVGFERQWRSSVAGLRTNALVSLGAALFVSVEAATGKHEYRIAAQIVTGIGFIGGGAILREGFTVRGVNTAATLWCSAAIGVLCGIGMLWQATLGTAFVLLANIGLRPITYWMANRVRRRIDVETHYSVTARCNAQEENRVRRAMIVAVEERRLMMRSLQSDASKPAGLVTVSGLIISSTRSDGIVEDLVQQIKSAADMVSIEWGIAAQGNDLE